MDSSQLGELLPTLLEECADLVAFLALRNQIDDVWCLREDCVRGHLYR